MRKRFLTTEPVVREYALLVKHRKGFSAPYKIKATTREAAEEKAKEDFLKNWCSSNSTIEDLTVKTLKR